MVHPLATAQDPGREHEQGCDQLEDALHGDAHQPEGQQQQPDDGIQEQQRNSQRPAQHKKDEPKENTHGRVTATTLPRLERELLELGPWLLAFGCWLFAVGGGSCPAH